MEYTEYYFPEGIDYPGVCALCCGVFVCVYVWGGGGTLCVFLYTEVYFLEDVDWPGLCCVSGVCACCGGWVCVCVGGRGGGGFVCFCVHRGLLSWGRRLTWFVLCLRCVLWCVCVCVCVCIGGGGFVCVFVYTEYYFPGGIYYTGVCVARWGGGGGFVCVCVHRVLLSWGNRLHWCECVLWCVCLCTQSTTFLRE